jgi:valyl-tRNA synthetase
MDTWATSSVTPLINARFGEADDRSDILLPMGLRAQAHEIIRTWAFYTIVKSLYHTNQIPWKDIMISGFVLAKKGEKISKSKNNAASSPVRLIETHSADVLRYWAANTRLGTDTFFSEDELKIAKRFVTKLWNASRFIADRLSDWKPERIETDQKERKLVLLPVDRWILERVKETTLRAGMLLEQYEIGQARHEIDELFWKDFCDYYIEIAKERLYQPEKHGIKERASGQYAMYHAFLGILKLYAVYTPHIADYIYQELYRQWEIEISIHQTLWEQEDRLAEELLSFGEDLKKTIMEVRKYKSEKNLSMREEIESVTATCDESTKGYFRDTEKDILACTNSRKIIYIVK